MNAFVPCHSATPKSVSKPSVMAYQGIVQPIRAFTRSMSGWGAREAKARVVSRASHSCDDTIGGAVTLQRHLRNRRVLLLLDNFEHLLDAAGDLAKVKLTESFRGQAATLERLRVHRQLDEALTWGPDPLHLAAKFGLDPATAIRYAESAPATAHHGSRSARSRQCRRVHERWTRGRGKEGGRGRAMTGSPASRRRCPVSLPKRAPAAWTTRPRSPRLLPPAASRPSSNAASWP